MADALFAERRSCFAVDAEVAPDAAASFATITTAGAEVFFAMRRDFAFREALLAAADFAIAAEILFCAALFKDADFATDTEAAAGAILLAVDAVFVTDAGFLVSGDFFAGALFVAAFFLVVALLESEASFLTFTLETLAVRFLRGVTLALELSPSALAYFFVRSSVNLSVRENERTTARAPSFAHFKAVNFDSSQTPSVKILRAANFKATPAPSFSAKGAPTHASPPAPIFATRPQRRQSFKILSEVALFCAQSPAAPQIAGFEALRARAFIANLRSRRFLRAREC
nr:hypothetical protein [uncultured Campylobacter sp.]